MSVPFDTLSPIFTFSALSTPACEDGISIDALSDSTVIRLCSTLIVSPGLASSSITETSSKSPMSGTSTSTGPAAAAAAGGGAVAAAGAVATAAGALAAPAAEASASSNSSSVPSATLSPSLTFSSFTTPACEDGISIDALSLSTVTSDCSTFTVSPALTSSSMTATSSKSPMSGTLTSTTAISVSLLLLCQACSGLIRSVSMPYFLMASATFAAGTVPSSASAFSAAMTM